MELLLEAKADPKLRTEVNNEYTLCSANCVPNAMSLFPDLPTSRSPVDSRLRSADPVQLHLQPIFARTRSYQQSFFPKTITLWNSIPAGIQRSTSIVEFKHKISVYL